MNTHVKDILSFRNLLAACAVAGALGFAPGSAGAKTRGILYVLNSDVNGNHIYAYWVDDSTGALTTVAGFPTPTGGTDDLNDCESLAVDRTNNRLYATNDMEKTVSAFSISAGSGLLTAMPFSPFDVGGTANLGSIAVHPGGSPVVIGTFGSVINSFTITPTTATAATGSPYSTPTSQSISLVFSPDGTNLYGGGNDTTGAAFAVNSSTGVLTTLGGSSFAAGSIPVGLAVGASGRLFLSNFNSSTVRAFAVSAGNPSPAVGNPFASGIGNGSAHGIVHPAGYYIASGHSTDVLGVFTIAGSDTATTLTAVTGSPFASGGAGTANLAMNDTGSLVFAANSSSRDVTSFSIDTATGALTALVTQPVDTIGSTGFIAGMAYTTVDVPDPAPAVPPTISVTGKKKITTSKSQLKIKGTATGPVASVKVKLGRKTMTARGTTNWSYKAKLKSGKNVLTITAVGTDGKTSNVVKVTITRK